MRSTPSCASSATFSSTAFRAARNSSSVPRLKFKYTGTTPMPSGNKRMNSSREPGRWVGLTTPTTPRQLAKTMRYPLRKPSSIVAQETERRGDRPVLSAVEGPVAPTKIPCRVKLALRFKQIRKLRLQLCAHALGHFHDFGKFPLELAVVGHTGIDQDPVIEIAGQKHWIASRRPGFLHQVDIGHRIKACPHS